MIYGIGIDMVEISRFRVFLSRHSGSLSRIFGEEELRQLRQFDRAESFAGNFCAKEAFSKAVGTGVRGFELRDIQIMRGPLGRPYFLLGGGARTLADSLGLSFFVSMTHTRSAAAAVVTAVITAENIDERCDRL